MRKLLCRKYGAVSADGQKNPFPGEFMDMTGTIRLHPVTRSEETMLHWSASFSTKAEVRRSPQAASADGAH